MRLARYRANGLNSVQDSAARRVTATSAIRHLAAILAADVGLLVGDAC
jgi:hypothetical protein